MGFELPAQSFFPLGCLAKALKMPVDALEGGQKRSAGPPIIFGGLADGSWQLGEQASAKLLDTDQGLVSQHPPRHELIKRPLRPQLVQPGTDNIQAGHVI